MSRLIVEPSILLELSEDTVISDFLDFHKEGTRSTYTVYFRRLKMFSKETGDEMLQNRKKWLRKVFAFQKYLKNEGYSDNYV